MIRSIVVNFSKPLTLEQTKKIFEFFRLEDEANTGIELYQFDASAITVDENVADNVQLLLNEFIDEYPYCSGTIFLILPESTIVSTIITRSLVEEYSHILFLIKYNGEYIIQ